MKGFLKEEIGEETHLILIDKMEILEDIIQNYEENI